MEIDEARWKVPTNTSKDPETDRSAHFSAEEKSQPEANHKRMVEPPEATKLATAEDSLEFHSEVGDGSLSYVGNYTVGTEGTGQLANYLSYHANDATDAVHEMHLALLYLLSNPEEFQRALATHPPQGATTLAEWNAEYEDNESAVESLLTATEDVGGSVCTTPLPFVVFADDAEAVLPQAHTASQLFGIERLEGIELEAAAGIPALSQLFLRWLALMPGGDHLNIIDPPGLTVMRIAGGRYRVTAAHRVVWTWMNAFAPLCADLSQATSPSSYHSASSVVEEGSLDHNHQRQRQGDKAGVNGLQIGDLVTMTIIDVFETDSNGKLLSYCPTFDNRDIRKTHQTAETLRKSSKKVMSMLGKAKKSKTAALIVKQAQSVARSVKVKVGEAVHSYNSPEKTSISDQAFHFAPPDDSSYQEHEGDPSATGEVDSESQSKLLRV